MEDSLDDGILVIQLSNGEKDLLAKMLSSFASNNWVYDNSIPLEQEDMNIFSAMSIHTKELFLSELVAGKNGYNCSGPYQTMVAGHERVKEIMQWKCCNRDKAKVNCKAHFRITKKGKWSSAHHSPSCLQTQKIIDLRILKQKIGDDLWSDALNHVAVVRRVNASQDQCFKEFKTYIKGMYSVLLGTSYHIMVRCTI